MVFETVFRECNHTGNNEPFRLDRNGMGKNHGRDKNRTGIGDRYQVGNCDSKAASRGNEVNGSCEDRYCNAIDRNNSKTNMNTNGARKDRYSNMNDASEDDQTIRESAIRLRVGRDRYDVDSFTRNTASSINNSFDYVEMCRGYSGNDYAEDRYDDFKENGKVKSSITDRYSTDMDRYS
mmetsp:Transcript_30985/g.73000  ORF Transcript_30985/g.73000 Transcript_30985/m.73000 type:complete len:179 (+) Transcript_30985:160-696(+)